MNANREIEIRHSVRAAITKLTAGSVYTLTDLFGKLRDGSADYGRALTILKRLVAGGLVIASERNKISEPKLYQAKNVAELERITSDEFELSRLIWPGRTPPKPVSGELVHALKALENVEMPAPAPPAPSHEPEILPTILKLLGAAIENLIYIREKVDGIESKIDALDSVGCSHCTNREAHCA